MDCALASIARGRQIRAVCAALGVSRTHVKARLNRPADWTDQRKAPPRADDSDLKEAISKIVHKRATYGYRRVWARLKLEGKSVNHKRVYRVMRDVGLLLYRHGQRPWRFGRGLLSFRSSIKSQSKDGCQSCV